MTQPPLPLPLPPLGLVDHAQEILLTSLGEKRRLVLLHSMWTSGLARSESLIENPKSSSSIPIPLNEVFL
jgi:hypothetical protein